MRIYFIIFSMFFFFCGRTGAEEARVRNDTEPKSRGIQKKSNKRRLDDNGLYAFLKETPREFDVRILKELDVSNLEIKGTPVFAAKWNDKRGENLIVLTQTGKFPSKSSDCVFDDHCFSSELFAYHYRLSKAAPVLVRKIHDYVRDCSLDLFVGFLKSAVSITDLDNDKIAEVAFSYRLSCRGDVSPSRMKLILLEDGLKFATRGRMTFSGLDNLTEEQIKSAGWGKFTLDRAFERAPRVFKDFAVKRWKALKAQDDFSQL